MTAPTAELVQVRYQKLKNINFAVCRITQGDFHEHNCLEVGMVLSGEVILSCNGGTYMVGPGGLLLFNAYESHMLSSENGARVLFAQLAPGFGKEYFARISSVEFDNSKLDQLTGAVAGTIRRSLLSASRVFFEEPEIYGMECAGWIAHMVTAMLRHIPYKLNTDAEYMSKKKKIGRAQRIANFVEQHYREKLSLALLAKAEGITTAYMSRIFGELFQKSFQEYLSELRLQKAIPMLKNPNMYLVDVCMECGFSDTRYLNAVCQKKYGCSAAQFRSRLLSGAFTVQDNADQGQTPYSDADSLRILDTYLNNEEEL